MAESFKEKMKSPAWRLGFAFLLVIIFSYFWQAYMVPRQEPQINISYSRFMGQLEEENIREVIVKGHRVEGSFKDPVKVEQAGRPEPIDARRFVTHLPTFQGEELISTLRANVNTISVQPSEEDSFFWTIVISILPWVLIIGLWIMMMRRTTQAMQGGPGGGIFGFGQSKAKQYDLDKPSTTFEDVAGMNNAKQDLMEIVSFLKEPEKFAEIGAEIPKGVILMGAPGTGKTLLARATAGEAGVPFYSVNASEFIEMFVGVGASRVRDMFDKAKKSKPSIVFIDEIDAIGRSRGAGLGGGHDEREQTLNQILAEMDGFEPNAEVIIIAATNRPDVLDPALLRPGRFDRRITVDRPGLKERLEILKVHTRKKKMAGDVDLEIIARGTPGMTGADLENLTNEAALFAVRKGRKEITAEDFEDARDKILMGGERQTTLNEEEKKITAYHEGGHTLVALKLPGTDPVHKVSIVPRGMAMGVTQLIPEEDRHYYPKHYLMNRLAVAMAGRVAEKLIFEELSTGAQNDLKQASDMAEKMVAQWGMSEKVGPMNLGRGEEHPFLGRELAQPKRYSEEMAWIMDQEIQSVLKEAEEVANKVLTENREVLERLAEKLIEKEELSRDEIKEIVGVKEKDK